ncbi:hypothetical protein EMIHUDRAFT_239539 [Emiliania huxleyi CCMP1516]|uniref:Prolyl 4-hydroxylase alpha subunit domain-containing protein n=2 Tax=Emiliania huxleyi TaxID=2903 RepID=A0A0D3JJ59_EMIH1|nr:hypothetical protein EMIHUDRAFT_239539 [Emiliania huxleyi CCMP1516]EOD23544.1 hypothetical protein EMIHUDRAFT_239539 [Emiliania huxleyi CCMP1516]|eukprot:XP_005775973.1 hypothetical protein EMIHUDRAFT_239539 [Emiliania huxleyi CCMP1516]
MTECLSPAAEAPTRFTEASAEADLAWFRSQCAADEAAYNARLTLQPALRLSVTGEQTRAGHADVGSFARRLECLRPEGGSFVGRHEPLAQRLISGRACPHALCDPSNCGLHLRDAVVLPEEARRLTAHGQEVIEAEDGASAHRPQGDLLYMRSRRVDFLEMATRGSQAGHLLTLRVTERLRRIVAAIFGLPRSHLVLAEHFLTLRQPGPSLEARMHCDEATLAKQETPSARPRGWAGRFHFSSVLWLSGAGADFDGGSLSFFHNSTRPWLEAQDPGVEPLQPGAGFAAACVRPRSRASYAMCRQQWATAMQA